jgi:hypothetical protein
MHHETPISQRPSLQPLLQHSESSEHALPELLHSRFSGEQSPSLHAPPQHSASLLHSSPSEVQATSEHTSSTQLREQQSVLALQESPASAHSRMLDSQLLVFGLQTLEQQSALSAQSSPKARHA